MTRQEYILWYRAKIDANLQQLSDEERLRQVEVETVKEMIQRDHPELESQYEFYWRGFVLPRSPEFDSVLADVAGEVRAAREEWHPETDFEKYIPRVDAKQANVADETFEEEAARQEKEKHGPARRAEKAAFMRRARAAFSWLKKAMQ